MNRLPQNVLLNFLLEFPKSEQTLPFTLHPEFPNFLPNGEHPLCVLRTCRKYVVCFYRDWLIGVGGWVVRRGSCVIAHASSRRLLLLTLYTTLRIHEKVSAIKFSKANLSAKYVLPGPLPFSRMLLAHSAFLMHMRPRKQLPVERKF